MNWLKYCLHLPRVPEPEVMDASGEVEAYSTAAAQSYLEKIDDTFVVHALRLLRGRESRPTGGRALDIGCGPGQIVLKLAQRLPGWQFTGLDRSANMVREVLSARDELARREHGDLASSVGDEGTECDFCHLF